jgi:DNA-binding transcriptional LysR family regulator
LQHNASRFIIPIHLFYILDSRLELNELRAFLAVADTRSFSTAASQLCLSQPAISKRIATLEQSLGQPLFDRIGRTIQLTAAGERLRPHARRILDEVASARHALGHPGAEISGRLRLGTSHHIGLHRLPPLLRDFIAACPAVDLELRFMESEAVSLATASGELDLGVITLPSQPLPSLNHETIWQDPLTCVVAHDHPLANDDFMPQQLNHYAAILPTATTTTRAQIDHALAPLGIVPRVALATNYLETIKMLVSVGLGWSLLPQQMVGDGQLTILRIPSLRLIRHLGLIHHRQRSLSPAAERFITLLRDHRPPPLPPLQRRNTA